MLPIYLIVDLMLFRLSGIVSQTLIILHNSNIRGRYAQTARDSEPCEDESPTSDCLGGIARTLTVIKEHRNMSHRGGPKVLYFNTGDTSAGSLWYSLYGWKIAVDFINVLKPDAALFGEHEFDRGIENMKNYIRNINAPIVLSNFLSYDDALSKIVKSKLLQLGNLRVGVVGYISPKVVRNYNMGSLKLTSMIPALKEQTKKLHDQGVNFIIALGHAEFVEDQKIAANVPYINIIVGGHSTIFLYNGRPIDLEQPEGAYPQIVEQASGKRVAIVHAYCYAKYLGRLNVTFDKRDSIGGFAGQPILLDTDIPQDQTVLDKLETYRPKIDEAKKDIIGVARVKLDATNKVCTMTECNLGNLITDAFLACMMNDSKQNTEGWADIAVALHPANSIASGINKRGLPNYNISMASIYMVLPYENKLTTCSLTGVQLLKVLEMSASFSRPGLVSKTFLQYSGIHVLYDLDLPPGSRVVSARVRCAYCQIPEYMPLEPYITYKIVTVEYITLGGGGYDMLRNSCYDLKIHEYNEVSAVANYIKQHKIVYPQIEGRIRFVDHGGTCCVEAEVIVLIINLSLIFSYYGI